MKKKVFWGKGIAAWENQIVFTTEFNSHCRATDSTKQDVLIQILKTKLPDSTLIPNHKKGIISPENLTRKLNNYSITQEDLFNAFIFGINEEKSSLTAVASTISTANRAFKSSKKGKT